MEKIVKVIKLKKIFMLKAFKKRFGNSNPEEHLVVKFLQFFSFVFLEPEAKLQKISINNLNFLIFM